MKRNYLIITLLVTLSIACSLGGLLPFEEAPGASEPSPQAAEAEPAPSLPPPTQTPTEDTPVPESGESPSMETCQAWIRENHSLDYVNHGCAEHADILQSVEGMGGGVIPVGDERFFIVWFPEGWAQSSDREIIFTLHGNNACTEQNFQWWQGMAEGQNFAVVALQYAEEDLTDEDPNEEHLFDEGAVVYANLTTAYDELQAHCPLQGVPAIYYGFSRGSALSYHLALLDRSPEGRGLFSAYIADSGGTGPAGTGDTPPGYMQDASPVAYDGAHFWLYCGMKDFDGVRCDDMEKASALIQRHGGVVDEFHVSTTGGHGIFNRGVSQATLNAMLDFIASVTVAE